MSTKKPVVAYSLISVVHGADDEVLKDLIRIDGVIEASLVYGEYDIHCRIEVDDMEQLKHVITEIRKLKVRTTETLITYERVQQRMGRLTDRRMKRHWMDRTRGTSD